MRPLRIHIPLFISALLLFTNCNRLIETEIQIAVTLSESVAVEGNIYAYIFKSSPDLTLTLTKYHSHNLLFNSTETPKTAIISGLRIEESIYLLIYLDSNEDEQLNITDEIPEEPLGGFGISLESADLDPMIVTEGMEAIEITIYSPDELYGSK